MTILILVEDQERIGFVDTESGDAEYNGDDPFIKGLVVQSAGKYLGAPSDDLGGPNQYFVGEELEAYIRDLPDEWDEVEFEVMTEKEYEKYKKDDDNDEFGNSNSSLSQRRPSVSAIPEDDWTPKEKVYEDPEDPAEPYCPLCGRTQNPYEVNEMWGDRYCEFCECELFYPEPLQQKLAEGKNPMIPDISKDVLLDTIELLEEPDVNEIAQRVDHKVKYVRLILEQLENENEIREEKRPYRDNYWKISNSD